MGPKHTKEEILAGAVSAALADGLSQLTFGRLAKRLGMNDRTIVYYFPTKGALIAEVLIAVGAKLQDALERTYSEPVSDHIGLARSAWPILAQPGHDRVFALLFEVNGLASAGQAPYDELAPVIVETWLEWMSRFVSGTLEERRAEAEAALALIDGLLLLRQLAGPDVAERAAGRLGVV